MSLRAMRMLLLFLCIVSFGQRAIARHEEEPIKRMIAAPSWKPRVNVIDGSGKEYTIETSDIDMVHDVAGNNRVPVLTVALCTLAMAAATGLGAVPFFFVELDPQWAGICNGVAAGVMLAASFDLIREGQDHGSGSWVVLGILAGSIFIMFCKKFLEKYGEVSMLDIKGAEAAKAILVVGIMTLHSVGEGSGVGVSFAGSKGMSQGILVALAIAVHNIPEGLAVSMVLSARGVSPKNAMLWSVITSLPQPIVAVPSFICAEAFNKLLPFATGFAAGCMIWMVMSEVLPDGFKEASPSHVASAATLSVAFMEALSTAFEHFGHGYNVEDASGLVVSLLFGLGPLLGGLVLIAFALVFRLHSSLLTSIASGIAAILSIWRPFQLLLSSKMGLLPILLISIGSALAQAALSCATKFRNGQKTSTIKASPLSPMTLIHAILLSASISIHAFSEGLALGVAAPRAYGLGRHIVLPVSLHGFPRGAAAASCLLGATSSWYASLLSATIVGIVGPLGAIGAILGRIGYNRLDHVMMLACGALMPCFWSIVQRGVKLDKGRSVTGFSVGAAIATMCLMCTKLVCLHTPYCNSAPEAVR